MGVVLNFKLNFSIAFFFPPSRFVESLVLVNTFLWQILSASVPVLLLSDTYPPPLTQAEQVMDIKGKAKRKV